MSRAHVGARTRPQDAHCSRTSNFQSKGMKSPPRQNVSLSTRQGWNLEEADEQRVHVVLTMFKGASSKQAVREAGGSRTTIARSIEVFETRGTYMVYLARGVQPCTHWR